MKTTRLKINRWIFPGTKRFFIKNIQNRRRMEKTRLKIDRWIFPGTNRFFIRQLQMNLMRQWNDFTTTGRDNDRIMLFFQHFSFFLGRQKLAKYSQWSEFFLGRTGFFFTKDDKNFYYRKDPLYTAKYFVPNIPHRNTSSFLFFCFFIFFMSWIYLTWNVCELGSYLRVNDTYWYEWRNNDVVTL